MNSNKIDKLIKESYSLAEKQGDYIGVNYDNIRRSKHTSL